MDKNKIIVFDTTLRDGEQSPGCSMNTDEKIKVALQLEKLGVDVIEAGFAAASPGDFDAVSQIAKIIKNSTICSLSRAIDNDIKQAGLAVSHASKHRIHTFIATSPIHMQYKLKMTPDEVIKRAVKAVQYAKTFVDDVEFSCEDAGRSEIPFLKEVIDAVIEAGAKTINLPDTVGYRLPTELASMIKELSAYTGDRAIISVHNHNDLGLATANTLASVLNGARQIEVTINGLGERAGNSALEEAVMAIKVRKDIFGDLYTNINTPELYATSRLVATITGVEPQQNKAIVGKNAFAHESGIHQDGVLKHQETYEIMRPEDVGVIKDSTLILGKHSGRAAFKDKIAQLGFDNVSEEELNNAFERFKVLADKKKDITDDDVRMLITDEALNHDKIFDLVGLQISDCSNGLPMAAVTIKHNNEILKDAALGDGTMDAIFKTIDRLTGYSGQLKDYKVVSVSEGKDSLAKVTTRVSFEENSQTFVGHGLSIDTMLATAKAYLGALNSYLSQKDRLTKNCGHQI
ncbi:MULTISPECIES: 2-isopropylmalate synthase [Arcobacteraceae]|uniref:2-isopropylmalate synthase n=1 Tax=Aliarcobacter thereius LMG 24486 TaxID=1032240 RepID=A0A1C7WMS8_9BACT|nr:MULTISPECIES: 2-isopropylmalate synthase [Arcobacteraceae]OCL84367.1 2-isopropylmalate synthase [Arcobacter porcinus]OCL94603.1 2-isopropylmalate synthase [Aliarcobacter thereius LMG 24486]QBF15520.1 2-isopropylmalate synthase, bacterial type [Aliarcobacter thereius LMG 24486]TLS91744.1 2-isopropylmalate synthase [Aliarcobacter thereius]